MTVGSRRTITAAIVAVRSGAENIACLCTGLMSMKSYRIYFSRHARMRMEERNISECSVLTAIMRGRITPVEGDVCLMTHKGIQVTFSTHENLVITVCRKCIKKKLKKRRQEHRRDFKD